LGQDVWVLAEHRGGELEEVTKEMLAEAGHLASKLGGQVCSVLLGDDVGKLAIPLAHYGADLVYMAEHPLLSSYTTDAYTDVICGLVQQYQPAILIFGVTPNGSDLAPRLATRLGVNLASDCVSLDLTGDGQLIATKPAYQDKLYAKVLYPAAGLQIATLRPGVRGVDEADRSRRCEVVAVPVIVGSERISTRRLGVIPADPRTVDVSEAERIVAGGRGVGDNFDSLWELADILGAAIGGTRVAVDRGWLPLERLIGATGKTVKPRLYLACGISGATQHSIGMKDSETVIAINVDRTAPIFPLADLGVLADLNQVIPALIRRLRQQRGGE
jgi:electron transfer flavoprotein alpha subunit